MHSVSCVSKQNNKIAGASLRYQWRKRGKGIASYNYRRHWEERSDEAIPYNQRVSCDGLLRFVTSVSINRKERNVYAKNAMFSYTVKTLRPLRRTLRSLRLTYS
jgi:hypothetical protein